MPHPTQYKSIEKNDYFCPFPIVRDNELVWENFTRTFFINISINRSHCVINIKRIGIIMRVASLKIL